VGILVRHFPKMLDAKLLILSSMKTICKFCPVLTAVYTTLYFFRSEKDFDELNKRGVICSEIKSHLTSSYKVLSFVNDVWFRGVLETKNKYSPGITLCR
jgi:hypothetical protein